MTALFDPFLHFDLRIFEWIQTIQGTFFDKIMVAITTMGEGGIVFILLALALICTKKYRKAGFAVLAALLVMEVGNNLILKEIFARPRPFNLAEADPVKYAWWAQSYQFPALVSEPSSYSFPSGHTSSAFAAAIAVLWYDRKIGIPTTIFAFIMGFTRIYVEVHYPSDVIAGAIVGVVYALLGVLLIKYLYPHIEKLFERIAEKRKAKKEVK